MHFKEPCYPKFRGSTVIWTRLPKVAFAAATYVAVAGLIHRCGQATQGQDTEVESVIYFGAHVSTQEESVYLIY